MNAWKHLIVGLALGLVLPATASMAYNFDALDTGDERPAPKMQKLDESHVRQSSSAMERINDAFTRDAEARAATAHRKKDEFMARPDAGRFRIYETKYEKSRYVVFASCIPEGGAFANVDYDKPNVYCFSGPVGIGGCEVGIGVDASLRKACGGR